MKTLTNATLLTLSLTLAACGATSAPATQGGRTVVEPSTGVAMATATATPSSMSRVSVHVHDDSGAPESNKAVVLEHADGTILSEVSTSAEGTVDMNAPAGSAIVISDDYGDYHRIQAIAGLHGNMAVAFGGGSDEESTGTVEVVTPDAFEGVAATYEFSIGCSLTSVAASQLGANVIRLPIVTGCDRANLALLTLAKDEYGRMTAYAYSSASDVTVVDDATVQVGVGAWRTDFASMTLSLAHLPADAGNLAAGTTIWHNGQAFDTTWFMFGEFPGSMILTAPAAFIDSVSFFASVDDGATWGTSVERRRLALPAAATIDFATDAIVGFHPTLSETDDHARPVVQWAANLPVDAISLNLSWYDESANAGYDSSVLASSHIGSNYRMPAVPESAAAARAPASASFSGGTATAVSFDFANYFESAAASPNGVTMPAEYDARSAWANF